MCVWDLSWHSCVFRFTLLPLLKSSATWLSPELTIAAGSGGIFKPLHGRFVMLERMQGFGAWNLDAVHLGVLSTLERQQSQGRGDGVTVFPATEEVALTCWSQPERQGIKKWDCRSVVGITGLGGGGRQMKVQHQSFFLLFFFN